MALRNRTIRTLVIPITVLLATGILFLDLSLSVGIATWLLYLLPMLFTIRARQRYYPLLFALLCTVLTGVGLLCHHSGIPKDQLELAITRRGIGVAVFFNGIIVAPTRAHAEARIFGEMDRGAEFAHAALEMAWHRVQLCDYLDALDEEAAKAEREAFEAGAADDEDEDDDKGFGGPGDGKGGRNPFHKN